MRNYVDIPIDPTNRRTILAGEIGFGSTTGFVQGHPQAVVVLNITTFEGMKVTPIALCVPHEAPGELGFTLARVSWDAFNQLRARYGGQS